MMILKKIHFSKKFNRRKRLNKHGEAPVEIMLKQAGSYAKYKQVLWIAPAFWDDKKREVKPHHPNTHKYNQIISDTIQRMRDYENTIINRHGSCHIDRLLSEYNRPTENIPSSFTEFYRQELELTKATRSLKTYLQNTYFFKKLCAYQNPVYFEDLNYDFLTRFQAFLKQGKRANSTVNKDISTLRTYVLKAIRKQYLSLNDNPFIHYKPLKEKEPPRVFLNRLELERWENFTFEPHEKHLAHKRDCFLLMAYTGLRFSDMVRLIAKEHIEQTKEGMVISISLEKTDVLCRIPLFALFPDKDPGPTRAEQVITRLIAYHREQYKHIKNREDLPFAKMTNQYLNRQLKLIAKRMGINKNVTTHAGTRTFCTTLYELGIQQKEIQRLRRHKTESMISIYVRLTDKGVVDKLLNTKWQ